MVFDQEPGLFLHALDKRCQIFGARKFDHLLTVSAYKVMTVGQAGASIAIASTLEVDAPDISQAGEKRQCAVHRHKSESGAAIPCPLLD